MYGATFTPIPNFLEMKLSRENVEARGRRFTFYEVERGGERRETMTFKYADAMIKYRKINKKSIENCYKYRRVKAGSIATLRTC